MSRIEIMSRRRTATHILEGISWENVSGLNERQDAHDNSLAGREIMATGQRFNSRPGGARQLTYWKGWHGRTSGIQFEARRRTKLTSWKGCHGCTSWIQMETRSPSKLGDSFLCRQFEITNLTCLLPISYIQNFPSFHIENITFFPLSFAIISIMSQKRLHLTPTYWISGLNFVTDIRSWYLHPEMSVVVVFTG